MYDKCFINGNVATKIQLSSARKHLKAGTYGYWETEK